MEVADSNGSVSRRSSRRRAVVSRKYDESFFDEQLDMHLGSSPKKKNRTQEDFERETQTETMIAVSLGFPINGLTEEEVRAEVVSEFGGKEENSYIVVRNHILARWRGNVRRWLSKADIRETVCSEYERFLSVAYDFLFYNGYINFGNLPCFVGRAMEEPKEGSVIVVGAGLSGLGAARQLLSFGFKVIVLEGRCRPGGRVYTQTMGQKDNISAVDLGGSVITGTHANPLGVLARQLSVPLHKIRDQCPLYKPDGAHVEKDIDSKVEFIFNKLLDKVTELRQVMGGFANSISLGSVLLTLEQLYAVARAPDEKQLLHWHLANLEYCNAGSLPELSAAHWDQDDPYEMGGDHCFLAGGNGRLIRALCEGVPVLYGKTVNTIRYHDDGVELITENQVYRADYVLCTVPLGVLKKRTIRFEPELPERKLAAIDRLGFGLLNKVALVFPYVFWEDLDTFGCLREESHQRGEYFLFYSYHTVSGGPVLIALVAGEAAQAFEQTDPLSSVLRVLNILKGIYGPKGISVPDPIQSICTRWGSDSLSYGSYSHVRVGSSGKDYDIIAENVGNRLFFAGEATARQYPATMHGAFLSGLREASRIFHATRGLQNHLKKISQKNLGTTLDMLVNLFKNPDLEFGNFFFVFDSLSPDPKTVGILKISLWCSEDICKEELENCYGNYLTLPLQVYTTLSREQAYSLLQLDGGSRLSYLTKDLGLQVMGASSFGSSANSLIASIASVRKGRGRYRLSIEQ